MIASLEDMQGVLLGNPSTLQASYDIARLVIERNVPGDFVECGVFAGAQSAAMAKAIECLGPIACDRHVHLFDSFEGGPAPGLEDEHFNLHHKAGFSACSLDQVTEYMRIWRVPHELLVYHPGWFEDTMPSFESPIAVLRIDCDLYASTQTVMRYLYPLVSPGGCWVICDDYNLPGCRKAINEYFAPEGAPGPIYWIKQ